MRRLLPLLLLFCSLGALAQGPFQPDERAYYGLIDRGSGRCLDIVSAGTNAGDAAVQWEFTHSNSQQWRFVPVSAGSEYFRIEAKHSTLCLTVPKPGEAVPLVQQPFQGGLGQQWRLVPAGPLGSFLFENRLEGRVAGLAAADKFNGTPMQAQKANGRASQQWHLFKLRLNVAPGAGFGPREPLAALNSSGNEIGPVLAPDGQTLYFGRTKFAGNTEGNTDTGDAWASQSPNKGKTWGPPQRLDALNTPQNNGVLAVVGAQGQTLLVRGTYNREGFRDEGVSRVSRVAAGPPGGPAKGLRTEDVDVANYYTAVPATGFFMTADEKVLLLSLERGDSEGGNDLYISRPAAAGGYSAPQSLGPVLNSPGFDFAPWLTPDGKTLYFSSYGHMGYGGADVFVSQRLDDSWTRWSEPQNLGPALNGPGFDAYFSLAADGETAYFASSATANASADLFRAGRAPVDTAAAAVAAAPAPVAETNRAFVSGRVLDARNRQPVPGATVKAVLLPNAQGVQFEATARTDAAGSFVLSLLAGRYRVAGASGLLSSVDTVAFAGNSGRDLLLRPAAVGEKVDLPTIIFAQGKATLLGTSYTELNRLAIALQAEPKTEVRLEGHTDNVGPADKNQQLSEDRVAEVKRYLVKRGVDENRISTAGYGGTRPRFGNDREETRRLNRRVELVIVK